MLGGKRRVDELRGGWSWRQVPIFAEKATKPRQRKERQRQRSGGAFVLPWRRDLEGWKAGWEGQPKPRCHAREGRKKKILQLHHLGKGNIFKRRERSRTGNERLASQLPRTSYMVFLCCFVRGRRVCAGRPDTGTGASSGWETLFAADDPLASWPPECLACIRPQDFLFFCLLLRVGLGQLLWRAPSCITFLASKTV